jgi:hypothetical protein
MKNNISRFSFISILSSFLAVAILCLQPAVSVFAMSPADDTNPPQAAPLPDTSNPPKGGAGNLPQAALGKLFKQEQKNHERQQATINKADKAGSRLSELIARAKENNKNTAGLEKALADFNTRLGEIRLSYDQTGRLIKQHSGFDDQGKVTDAEKAKTTLEEIRKGNQEVRQSLTKTVKDLREAGKEYRQANPRPTATPPANPA